MTDVVSKEVRSRIMSRIRSKDTRPEMVVRRTAHSMGYRYRLHRRDLPGTPDIVFPSRRAVVFVNGCFWHRHDCEAGRKMPKSNVGFWSDKFTMNVQRNIASMERLTDMGWRILEVWECDLKKGTAELRSTLSRFLG